MSGIDNLKPFTGADDPRRGHKLKGVPHAATRYARFLKAKTKTINPVTGEEEVVTYAELLDIALFKKAAKGDVQAYKEVLDRLEGKSIETVKTTATTNMQVVMHDQARNEAVFNKQED